MGNQILSSGTFTVTSNTIRATGTVSDSINTVSTAYISETQQISTSSLTPLVTSSLTDIRLGYFTNNDLTASITLYSGSYALSILPAGDTNILGFSGSNPALYAKGTANSGTTVPLQYILSSS